MNQFKIKNCVSPKIKKYEENVSILHEVRITMEIWESYRDVKIT